MLQSSVFQLQHFTLILNIYMIQVCEYFTLIVRAILVLNVMHILHTYVIFHFGYTKSVLVQIVTQSTLDELVIASLQQ